MPAELPERPKAVTNGTEPVACPVLEWDFAPRKPCTDIVVHGHARSPGAARVTSMRMAVRIGDDRRLLDGLRLPNFETPEHDLTPDRLVLDSPGRWPWAPEPAGFGWLGQTWFLRSTLLGLEPAFESLPAPLRQGWLELPPEFVGGPDPRFYSGASSGMRRVDLRGDELVELHGFHHEGSLATVLPGDPPRVTIMLRQRPLDVVLRLHTIELFPDNELATLVWVAEARMPQVLPLSLPGADAESFDVLEGVDVLVDGVPLSRDVFG